IHTVEAEIKGLQARRTELEEKDRAQADAKKRKEEDEKLHERQQQANAFELELLQMRKAGITTEMQLQDELVGKDFNLDERRKEIAQGRTDREKLIARELEIIEQEKNAKLEKLELDRNKTAAQKAKERVLIEADAGHQETTLLVNEDKRKEQS